MLCLKLQKVLIRKKYKAVLKKEIHKTTDINVMYFNDMF